MAQQTLLQLTQSVLASIDGDEVTTISQTVESQQVAVIIQNVFNDIFDRAELKLGKQLFQLTNASVSQPTLCTLPTLTQSVVDLEWLQYDKHLSNTTTPLWGYVNYLSVEEFFMLVNSYSQSLNNNQSYSYVNNGQTFTIWCLNNIAPSWFTTLDDKTFLFDSYDNTVDASGLVGTKGMAYGQLSNVFSLTDTYTPPLEDHQFSLLLQASCARAWVELKQQANPKAEQSERRQWIHLQKTRRTKPTHVPAIQSLPDYGRRGGYRQDWGADNMIYWMRKGK